MKSKILLIMIIILASSVVAETWDFQFEDESDGSFENTYVNQGKLELKSDIKTFNNLWIALALQGTISKVDTTQGREVARYYTGENYGQQNYLRPSRTAVDAEGNVWVGNRKNANNIVKIAGHNSSCIDRNGNGVIDTSHIDQNGYVTLMPWDANQDGIPDDECILVVTENLSPTPAGYTADGWGGVRAIAIDEEENVWVGLYSANKYIKLNKNGQRTGIEVSTAPYAPYGGLIDENGILWTSTVNALTRIDTKAVSPTAALYPSAPYAYYGITKDKKNRIWLGGWSGTGYANGLFEMDATNPNNRIIRGSVGQVPMSPWPALPLYYGLSGVTVDNDGNIWGTGVHSDRKVHKYIPGSSFGVAGSFACSANVGGSPHGVATDSEGYVWAMNFNGITSKINPDTCAIEQTVNLGTQQYTYSDATGSQLFQFVSEGSWAVTLTNPLANNIWNKISWDEENNLNNNIRVERKSMGENFMSVENGVEFNQMSPGMLVKVTMSRYSKDEYTPFFDNLEISASCVANESNDASCNYIDNDCDGTVDEDCCWCKDVETDEQGCVDRINSPGLACDCNYTTNYGCVELGWTLIDSDCDDNNYSINPGVQDICGDNIDNNCNRIIDECDGRIGLMPKNVRCEIDYSVNIPNDIECKVDYLGKKANCTIPAATPGIHRCDATPLIMINPPVPNEEFMPVPGLSAIFEGINCDSINTSYDTNYYYANCKKEVPGCEDNDGDGYGIGCTLGLDCDDTDRTIFSANTEICDGKDNNCDGKTDYITTLGDLDETCGEDICSYGIHYDIYCNEGVGCSSINIIEDNDGDGADALCSDCDDNDPARFNGNPEICDGIDNNCDGFLMPYETVDSTGIERCGDGIDTDCDGVDLPCCQINCIMYEDSDGDGQGDPDTGQNICRSYP